jgi:hypothetical protein
VIRRQLRLAASLAVGAAAAIAWWLSGEDTTAGPPDGGTPLEQRNVA